MAIKANNFYLKIFVIIPLLAVFFLGGCTVTGENTDGKESPDMAKVLPPIEKVLPDDPYPDDPYLFLPLEHLGFQLIFTEEVDPAVVEEAVSFEPHLAFTVQTIKQQYAKEIYLQPQEKLLSDTKYTMRIKGVQNETTGKAETIEFIYHTEFQGGKQIADLQWSHDGEEILYLVHQEGNDTAELWKVNVKDGNEQLLATEVAWPGRASWSPDDNTILYTKMVALPDKNYLTPEVCSVNRECLEKNVVVSAQDLEEISCYT
ncbi:MAG: hypothetical protein AB1420_08020 [Bacillota bacterium]